MPERVNIISRDGEEILLVDYSDLKEDEMIETVYQAKAILLKRNKAIMILSVYNDHCYATPKFMITIRSETSELMHLMAKQAVVGLSPVKKMILKGYNFLFNKNIKNFDSIEEAIKFLTDKDTLD